MASVSIPVSDPKLFGAVVQSTFRSPTDQARWVKEAQAFLSTYEAARGTASTKDLGDAVVAVRTGLTKAIDQGRGPFDGIDLTKDVIGIADAGARALPVIGAILGTGAGLEGTVAGWVGGKEGRDFVHEVTGGISDILGTPFAQDLITEHRAVAGFDAGVDLQHAMLPHLDQLVEEFSSIVRSDPEAANAAATLWPQLAAGNATIDPTPGAVVTNFPQTFNAYQLTVKVDNSVVVDDIDETRTAVIDTTINSTNQVLGAIASTQKQLQVINATQNSATGQTRQILALLEAQKLDADQKAAIEKARADAAATVNAVWQAGQGVTVAASAIARLVGDPGLAATITQVGGGVITAAQSTVGFVNAISALSGKELSAASALGTVAATGNLIGAAVGLLNLFAPGGPTPEQQILQQVQKLQQSLGDLHQDMTDSFQRLDTRLDEIYKNLMGALSSIGTAVELTLDEVTALRSQLVDLEVELSRFEISMLALMQAQERVELKEAINGGLGFRERNDGRSLSAEEFNRYSTTFFTWATDLAFDEINQPLAGREVDNAGLAQWLDDGALADNVSYVNRALLARGITALAPQPDGAAAPLPNPRIWALAARAYVQLTAEWPDLADPNDTRPAAIATAGRKFAVGRARVAGDSKALPALLPEYQKTVEALGDALATRARAKFEAHDLSLKYGHGEGNPAEQGARPNVLQGTDQVISFMPDFGQVKVSPVFLKTAPPDLAPPAAGVINIIPPLIRLADWFSPEGVKRELHMGVSPETKPVRRREEGKWVTEDVLTGYNLNFGAVYAGTALTEVTSVGEVISVGLTTLVRRPDGSLPDIGTVAQFAIDNWDKGANLQSDVQTWLLRVTPPPAVPSSIAAEVTKRAADGLQAARAQFYPWLATQLEKNGECGTEATAVTGARALLESAIRLLLPGPRTGDDVLRALFDGVPENQGGALLPDIPALQTVLQALDPAELPAVAKWLQDKLTAATTGAAGVLKERLSAWSAAIETGEFTNPDPEIDDPLSRLDLMSLLVQVTHAMANLPTVEEDLVSQLPLLKRGATGPGVRRLQGLLRAAVPTSTDATLAIDGSYGPKTQTAVQTFQRQNHLTADGVVGQNTWKALLGV